jgi:hypothetical protein
MEVLGAEDVQPLLILDLGTLQYMLINEIRSVDLYRELYDITVIA